MGLEMKVVRYTFDVCVRDCIGKDTYSLAPTLEKAIASCEGVCGCETVWKGLPGFLTVNVDAAIEWQQRNKEWLDGKNPSV